MTKKVITMLCLALTLVSSLVIGVSADAAAVSEASNDLSGFIDGIMAPVKDVLTLENLAIILVAALGFGLIFFLCWFAYRFVMKKVKGGVTKGKVG